MQLTKLQIKQAITQHVEKENGINDVMVNVYSKSSISRMLDGIREEVEAWKARPLEEYYPIILVDAVHVKVRREDHVSTEAFYVVLGVTTDRRREVLAIMNLPQESANGWNQLFIELHRRGVRRVGLMIADGLKGLDNALSAIFPGTPLQRCVTHLKRNLFARVKTYQRVELAYRDYFTYLAYDYQVRGMIYTTNWIERLQRDFRRVLRQRSSMPGESVITLMGKVAIEKKCYFRALPKPGYEKSFFAKPEVLTTEACVKLESMLN